MSEIYDVTEVIKKLNRFLGRKWVAIIRKANLKLKVRKETYLVNGNGLARLRITLRNILGKEVADDILSLAKPLAVVSREVKFGELIVGYDRASIETESKALLDPFYFSSLLISSSIVVSEKLNITEFNMDRLFKKMKLKNTETYFMRIVHESGDVYKLIVSKGVVKAVVLERVEGIKVYGYAALNFLFKLKGGIEITVLKLIS